MYFGEGRRGLALCWRLGLEIRFDRLMERLV